MSFSIYKIDNTVNSKLYVGCTSTTLEARLHGHVMKAINPNGVKNGSLFDLHRDMREFGVERFSISLIESGDGDKNIMHSKESHWIRELSSLTPNGYNMRARILTDEQIATIRYDALGITSTAYARLFDVSLPVVLTAKTGQGCGYQFDPYSYITREHLPTNLDAFLAKQ